MDNNADGRTSGGSRTMRKLRETLDIVATIAIIAVCGAMLWILVENRRSPPSQQAAPPQPLAAAAGRPAPPLPGEPLSLEGSSRHGSSSAKVAVIEFSDFQCPYCGIFARDTLPTIDKEYIKPGKVVFVFRHLPLEQIHPHAFKAGEAVECAGAQGKFWAMHDRLFENPKALDDSNIRTFARQIGLDESQFAICMKGTMAAAVRKDTSAASALAVTGTPTFFLGRIQPDGRLKVTQRLTGAVSFAHFQSALDKLLAER
jgi:protein-disulfide isomerase